MSPEGYAVCLGIPRVSLVSGYAGYEFGVQKKFTEHVTDSFKLFISKVSQK